MSCNAETFIEIFAGDNQEIPITITQDGARVPNIQTETTQITFQAKDSNGTNVMNLTLTAAKITLSVIPDSNGNDQDVATLKPAILDTSITPATYDIFMRIDRSGPARQDHIEMSKDGVVVTQLKIKSSGIT